MYICTANVKQINQMIVIITYITTVLLQAEKQPRSNIQRLRATATIASFSALFPFF
jgi:hypothetical protein